MPWVVDLLFLRSLVGLRWRLLVQVHMLHFTHESCLNPVLKLLAFRHWRQEMERDGTLKKRGGFYSSHNSIIAVWSSLKGKKSSHNLHTSPVACLLCGTLIKLWDHSFGSWDFIPHPGTPAQSQKARPIGRASEVSQSLEISSSSCRPSALPGLEFKVSGHRTDRLFTLVIWSGCQSLPETHIWVVVNVGPRV